MTSSANLINSLFNSSTDRRPTRRRQSRRSTVRDRDIDDQLIDSAELLRSLNQTFTVADLILNDNNKLKQNAINVISKQSAVAKSLLVDVENKNENIHLNTMQSMNMLKFLSDVYDNKFVMVNQ
ncbi:P12 [Chrysodeixis includens nucleopolyhedrovirus]|uniref:P12 n=1 Tax=Chrysodeixis includens nucleopolyhedrovirus TaxID=1207438 RepID=A0A5B8YTZ5_9ABAC|nr:P12 [Chrysodeixis includens nucleopolyhedrovirus]QED40611.1 P12 [Chrysodeixis includens nucleopolyhedrovirus]